jgi:hypothetical protein
MLFSLASYKCKVSGNAYSSYVTAVVLTLKLISDDAVLLQNVIPLCVTVPSLTYFKFYFCNIIQHKHESDVNRTCKDLTGFYSLIFLCKLVAYFTM